MRIPTTLAVLAAIPALVLGAGITTTQGHDGPKITAARLEQAIPARRQPTYA